MQVVFHMGAHCTDEGQFVRSLARDRSALEGQGVVVPEPPRFRPLVSEAMRSLRGRAAPKETQEAILDAVTSLDSPARLVLSSDTFLGAAPVAVGDGRLYPRAGDKTPGFPALFPEAGTEFMLAIRNPATFLPALHARLSGTPEADALARTDPRELRWSDLVQRLRAANPSVPLTVWCDEDAPFVWPEVLAFAVGGETDVVPSGGNDRASALLSEDGRRLLADYLEKNRPQTVEHRRRITAAFLDKFATSEALEQELDLPGWTDALVEELTARYEDDATAIAAMEGVTFLSAWPESDAAAAAGAAR